ncbi:VOC family protein [Aquimarina aquimarini]|uniref:VOC family protein n=1 Tax=Aquimarina aquimarini TaxID=1191734 RepID=UPI000D562400|nr:VOC family protein [Aquimarina aquimarini]
MKRIILNTTVILAFSLMACNNQNKSNPEVQKVDSNQEQITNDMKSFISLFEIPATDISRAVNFYQAILDINIQKMEMPGMEMGIFPYEGQMVTGVIMKTEGYKPSADGVTIYLNGGNNLQTILDKVEKNGGKIIVPKTAHADENGFFALFLDTEGNKIGLNSPN